MGKDFDMKKTGTKSQKKGKKQLEEIQTMEGMKDKTKKVRYCDD